MGEDGAGVVFEMKELESMMAEELENRAPFLIY